MVRCHCFLIKFLSEVDLFMKLLLGPWRWAPWQLGCLLLWEGSDTCLTKQVMVVKPVAKYTVSVHIHSRDVGSRFGDGVLLSYLVQRTVLKTVLPNSLMERTMEGACKTYDSPSRCPGGSDSTRYGSEPNLGICFIVENSR